MTERDRRRANRPVQTSGNDWKSAPDIQEGLAGHSLPPMSPPWEPQPPWEPHKLNILNENKKYPVATGFLDYFPDAALEVAHCSLVSNEQHNPGQKLHWDRSKSADEADACVRHLLRRGTFDSDGIRHSAKAAWRAMALLQKEIEEDREK